MQTGNKPKIGTLSDFVWQNVILKNWQHNELVHHDNLVEITFNQIDPDFQVNEIIHSSLLVYRLRALFPEAQIFKSIDSKSLWSIQLQWQGVKVIPVEFGDWKGSWYIKSLAPHEWDEQGNFKAALLEFIQHVNSEKCMHPCGCVAGFTL
jgi:hypothetical protein